MTGRCVSETSMSFAVCEVDRRKKTDVVCENGRQSSRKMIFESHVRESVIVCCTYSAVW